MFVFAESSKTDGEIAEEGKLLDELLDVVEQRNNLVAMLEEDRVRWVKEAGVREGKEKERERRENKERGKGDRDRETVRERGIETGKRKRERGEREGR